MSNEVMNAWGSLCVAIVTMEVVYCVYWLVKGYIEERRAMSDALQGVSDKQREVLWIAMDADGRLWMYDNKPAWDKHSGMWINNNNGGLAAVIREEWFPWVTPESPVNVELKIIEK